jgi:hypothetical protein
MIARRLLLSLTASPIRYRTMASSAAKQKLEWLVMIPDKPNSLEKRLQVRP